MNTFVKYPQRQDCHFKLSSGNSGETSINLSTEIAIFLNGGRGMTQGEESSVSFIIYKEDFIKAVCHIFEKLPLYKTSSTSSTKVEFSNSLFLNYTESINSFFGNEESKIYTITLSAVSAPRYYLKNLNYNGFNIRKFLVENNSTLQFSKSEEGFVLRLLSGEVKLEGDELVFKNTPTLILKNSVLKNFILDTLIYFQKYEALENLAPYASASSPIKISSSSHGFALTGMFLDSTLEDVQSRNKGHIRWFEEPLFSINGKSVFLSTQWNSKGNYQLTLPDFKKLIEVCFEDKYRISVDSEGFFELWKNDSKSTFAIDIFEDSPYRPYLIAIKSKPFLLLAGISGTGKSRIVRELARACWDEGSEEYKAQKPENFEMIQVKPNWHDSTELIGYVSRVSGEAVYVIGDFLRFVTKAWENLDVPYFLCLDEMNLAPVEQYFAEFLSVIESRKSDGKGHVTTDPILKKSTEDWYRVLTAELTGDNEALRTQFLEEGIALPQNLIVVGTVNMDETTFSFSRKVLDRAMTIEMNEVDLWGGLDYKYERIGKLSGDMLIGKAVEGVDVYADNKEVCDIALEYLKSVNEILDKTPFKVAYRTRNEFLLYVVNNLPYTIGEDGTEYSRENVIATALDEITSMKVLSRIEGDDTKVPSSLLAELKRVIREQLLKITGEDDQIESVSLAKLDEMQERLKSGYTSFWS